MKNKLAVVLAVLVVVAGVFAFQSWRNLHAERTQGAQLAARVAALESGLPSQAPLVAEAAPATTPAAPPPATSATAPVETPAPGSGSTQAPPPATASEPARSPTEMFEALAQTPQGRESVNSMLRSLMEQMYPDVATELDLTPEETAKLFDLLLGGQDAVGDALSLMAGGGDPAANRERQRQMIDKQLAQERELQAMLGGKYGRWEQYQATAAARQQVDALRTTLAAAGSPLSDGQADSLRTAFAAEQLKTARDTREWMSSPAAAESPNLMQESMRQALESQRKLLDAAGPHLNAAQLALYRRQVEQQERMLQVTMGMMGGGAAPR